MKKILFVMRSAPYQGCYLQEKLDIILTTAAFDQSVSLLFVDDGVFQLKHGQQPEVQQYKNTASIFKALEIYDIDELYVETESLQERGLKSADLILPVSELYRKQIGQWTQCHTLVLSG